MPVEKTMNLATGGAFYCRYKELAEIMMLHMRQTRPVSHTRPRGPRGPFRSNRSATHLVPSLVADNCEQAASR